MWTGAFISHTGSWMQNTTVPFVIFQLTHSTRWLGFAAFCHFFPALFVGPVGGTLADRISRRRLLVMTQTGAMLAALALWAAWSTGNATPGLIVGIVASSGVVFGLGQPAWHSFVPQLVPREELLNAVTLNSAQFNAARAVGPMIAGATLASFGAGAAFLVNAISYLAVIGALLAVRARKDVVVMERRGGGTFGAAVTYVRNHTGIRTALLSLSTVMFLGSPVISLLAAFAKDEFGVGEGRYGLLTAALGIGAVTAALLLSAYGDGIRRSRLVRGSITLFACTVIAMSVAPGYWAGVSTMFVFGAGYLLIASSLNSTIQLLTDDEYRGRVLALFGMSFTASLPLGALLQGWLADVFGVRLVVAVAGFMLLGFSGFLWAKKALLVSFDEHLSRAAPALAVREAPVGVGTDTAPLPATATG